MIKNKSKNWKDFHLKSLKHDKYPKYPQELMLKTIFGRYTEFNLEINKKSKILDVGCGFGNNLVPFIDLGCEVHGVEIDSAICKVTKSLLSKKYYKKNFNIKVGHNRSIPFENRYFDLVITNTLHYESSLSNINLALKEYSRVIRKGGYLYITTTGNHSDFFKNTKKISKNIYLIKDRNDKIRFGKKFFFFEDQKFFKKTLLKQFRKLNLGRDTNIINGICTDFFMAFCKN